MKVKDLVGISSNKTKQIIVARYKEPLSWLKRIKNVPFIVYDKRDKTSPNHIPNLPVFPIHRFEGIKHAKSPTGRESHTYLYHIIKHYDHLADINIFLQGNPVEICSTALDPLRVLLESDFEDTDFLPLNFPLVFSYNAAHHLHRGLPMERVFKRLFQSTFPDFFAHSWGAMFCVSKTFIHKRPLAFYEEMMQIVYEEPLSGYVYERLWPTILACHEFLPHHSYSLKNRAAWQLPGLQ